MQKSVRLKIYCPLILFSAFFSSLLIAKHHETLFSSLKNDDLKVFEKYVDCFAEYASLIECQAFEIGFKLAVKLFTEQ